MLLGSALKKKISSSFKIMEFREFSGGPVVRTGHLHSWGPGFCAECENLNLLSRACGMLGLKKKRRRIMEFKN